MWRYSGLLASLRHSTQMALTNPHTKLQTVYLFIYLVYLGLLALWVIYAPSVVQHKEEEPHSHYGTVLIAWLVLAHALCRFMYNVAGLMACTQGFTRAASFLSAATPTTEAPHYSTEQNHTSIKIPSNTKHRDTLPTFPYGTHRIEVLARFSLSIFTCFLACTLCTESIHSLFEYKRIHLSGLFRVACVGIVMDVLGAALFGRLTKHFPGTASSWWSAPTLYDNTSMRHSTSSHDSFPSFASYSTATSTPEWLASSASHSPHYLSSWCYSRQSRDFFRRILVGSFPYFALIFIAGIIGANNFSTRYDALCTMVCAALLVLFQVSDLHLAAIILLQTTPPHMQNALAKCMRELSTIDGVLESHSDHFWTLGFNSQLTSVGTLVVRVQEDADEAQIARQCKEIFCAIVNTLHVQIEKDSFATPTLPHHYREPFAGVVLDTAEDSRIHSVGERRKASFVGSANQAHP